MLRLAALDDEGRLALLIGDRRRPAREAGDLVDLFVERDAFLQVLELHGAADFGEDGEGVRIPLGERLAELDAVAVLDLELGAVDDRVALLFAARVSSMMATEPERFMATRSPSLLATVLRLMKRTVPVFLASRRDCSATRDAGPPMWKVRMVSCVPGSPMDCAAMTPTASPISTMRPEPRLRP